MEKRQGHTEMPHGPCTQAAGERSRAGPGATGVCDVPGTGLGFSIYWASSRACHAWVSPDTGDCPREALLHLAASSPADGVVPGGVLPQTGHSMHSLRTGASLPGAAPRLQAENTAVSVPARRRREARVEIKSMLAVKNSGGRIYSLYLLLGANSAIQVRQAHTRLLLRLHRS